MHLQRYVIARLIETTGACRCDGNINSGDVEVDHKTTRASIEWQKSRLESTQPTLMDTADKYRWDKSKLTCFSAAFAALELAGYR